MLVQTTPPAEEPISLAEARLQLKLTADDPTTEDPLIETYISAARQYAEAYTGRSFITQGWRLVLDGFPRCVELEKGVVQTISAITYRDMAGQWQTLDSSVYATELSGCPGLVSEAFGQAWPQTLPQIGSVRIDYTAGYGDVASDVPAGIRNWILLRVETMFEHRGENAAGVVTPLPHVDRMLDPFCVVLA
ncbi:MAG TPA: phage head-tail connector protein [Noviherbaspirillum sp.]|nr:phage head-tail connector protein [Noviherbaspirillum sp.]